MADPEVPERIAARRAELDEPEEHLVKQLDEVLAERDELAVAERVLTRMSERTAGERAAVTPASAQGRRARDAAGPAPQRQR
ncbi:hypothetical protein [Streptomyces sp. NPDC048385]|uniref:hypothetical protein n=1 Tax=Streptomyces sp. NPDC048385 TaxID=3155145 RepID=UPI003423C5BE